MEYAVLAEAYARAETTTKRLELAQIVAGVLEEAPPELVAVVVRLSQGRLAPDFEGIELGLSEKLVIQAITRVASVKDSEVTGARNRLGDIGSAAEELLARKTQAVLFRTPLTVQGVHNDLMSIAQATGTGSQDKKLKILHRMLSEATPQEARFLVRTVTGKLRLGIQDATVLDAVAALITDGEVRSVQEMEEDVRAKRDEAKALLEHANDVSSDLGFVAATALAPLKEAERRLAADERDDLTRRALEALHEIHITVGTPLRAMLAERMSSPNEIIEKLDGQAALEYKYDGLRVQVHIPESGPVKVYSRRLEDLTAQFPDVAETVRAAFKGRSAVVEGEAVAIDPKSGLMLPFQVVSHRRGRKTGIAERAELSQSVALGLDQTSADRGAAALRDYPIATYLFDLLCLDGEEYLQRPYLERREALAAAFDETERVAPSKLEVVDSAAAIERFMQAALNDGAEGVMAKNVASRYKAGARDWSWIKYKADYVEGLADTLDLVVVGAFHGQGRRTGWYGAFLLAAWDPDRGRYATVCRVATGFDDATLAELKERLQGDERDTPPDGLHLELTESPDVWFEPNLVMEVSGAEFTLSPVHTCAWGEVKPDAGIAVRFPRFTGRFRDDKGPTDTTTPGEIVSMYEAQVKIAARA